MTEMATRFGLEEKSTPKARTQKEWIRRGYEQTQAEAPSNLDPIKLPGL